MPRRKTFKRKVKKTNVLRRVKRLERQRELKYIDETLSGTATTTPLILQLSNIDRGTDDNSRIGNKVSVVGVQLRYYFVDDVVNWLRVMFVIDKQTNEAIYTSDELLADNTPSDNILSPLNRDNQGRFSVLYDKVHTLTTINEAGAVRRFFKLNLPIMYDGTGAGIADVTVNSLSLIMMCQASDVIIRAFVRVFYYDT